ncbi:MAG TPA: 16S rRNA (guanine(527)-N(7))-methyltransferase RsmG [Anaeromyxobacteraceae bacterium]|nr:16S rRNA (guanine(527)-N(7))-methyltransferase RsmG [Anaeromyxobacteraceae bacterium]
MRAPFREVLEAGLAALGLSLEAGAPERLERYADLLLRWNRRVNLTAVTDPADLAERHLVDSLALLRVLGPARSLLDVGSGAGLPGIPLAIARPALAVTCCDAVARKVAFIKAAAAALDLGVRGVAVRAAGEPAREGLPLADLVVSRALADPGRWLPLGARYLAPGGRLVAMLGREAEEAALAEVGRASALALERVDRFALPRSGASRANAVFRTA